MRAPALRGLNFTAGGVWNTAQHRPLFSRRRRYKMGPRINVKLLCYVATAPSPGCLSHVYKKSGFVRSLRSDGRLVTQPWRMSGRGLKRLARRRQIGGRNIPPSALHAALYRPNESKPEGKWVHKLVDVGGYSADRHCWKVASVFLHVLSPAETSPLE